MALGRTHLPALGRELLAALAVLALLSLSFAHVPVAQAAQAAQPGPALASWCGGPPGPGSADAAPCPACRIGAGVDLPSPLPGVGPVDFPVTAVSYAAAADGLPPPAGRHAARARAPPAA